MEFGGSRTRRRMMVVREVAYPCSLQFYTHPPEGNVSLMEFDEMAIDRLKVLRSVERINLSGQVKNSEEWMNKLYDEFAKNKNFIYRAEKVSENKMDEIEKGRRKDHISHYILRLAYCRTEELRRWFISHETDLFRARFLHAQNGSVDIKKFMASNNLHFSQLTPEELRSERENLICGTYNVGSGDRLEGRTFYKVPFTEALELVRTRKVFLKKGFAYVPDTDLVALVTAAFRTSLSHALAVTSRALPQVEDDERLIRLLYDFDKRYTGNDYNQQKKENSTHITPAMINQLSVTSFPLCMRQLNDALRTNHHLRHGGRMQYGLFLKAAGLKLEDALQFWRSHFVNVMDGDKFEKQYAYTIRHNYGKEGKRTDYTPYSCLKIIMTSVGPGDAHGCPFKHTDPQMLRHKLSNFKVSQQAITDIMDLVSKSHYQIACQKYWEATHNAEIDSGINHPNQYFEESQKLLMGISKPTVRSKVSGKRAVLHSSQSQSMDSQSTCPSSPSQYTNTQLSMTPSSAAKSANLSMEDMDSLLFDDDMDTAMSSENMEGIDC
ncbi:DNA primase subunit 2 [Oratosquilla oratoria]|uniref:DNA primase subunit 2 n=1 Tax=Oratosquilla oratoria TaxID=337810 RepID=UPI003F75DC0C